MRQYRVCDSIDAYEFEKSLDKACTELDRVDGMSEAEACTYCNTDTKEEAIKLLKESKLSNYVISKQTHISQSTLGNYKNGKTKPTPANTEILLQFFSSENVLAIENEAIPLNQNYIINVPLVNQYAQAGYLCGFQDAAYIATLPTIPL